MKGFRFNKKTVCVMITAGVILSFLTGFDKTNANDRSNTYALEKQVAAQTAPDKVGSKTEKASKDKEVDVLSKILSNKAYAPIKNEVNLKDKDEIDETNIDYVIDEFRRIYLFNDKYFDDLLPKENYSLGEINTFLLKNQDIESCLKPIIAKFNKKMLNYYEGIDNRIYAENLKSVVIRRDTEKAILEISGGEAYYNSYTNEIVIRENFDVKNSIDVICLEHELGHMFTDINISKDKYLITSYFNYFEHGKMIKEALNVNFTSNPNIENYTYEERNHLGYEVPANIMSFLLSSIDYDYNDSIHYNIYNLEEQLNEYYDGKYDFNQLFSIMQNMAISFEEPDFEFDQPRAEFVYNELASIYVDYMLKQGVAPEEIPNYSDDFKATLLKGAEVDTIVPELIDKQIEKEINSI